MKHTVDTPTPRSSTMRKVIVIAVLMVAICFILYPRPIGADGGHAGHPLVIELDNTFIEKYANRATITSEFTITGISADHPDPKDGEVHNGRGPAEARETLLHARQTQK